LGPRNIGDQKTQKVVTTTKIFIKKKSALSSRTPSLSPKKKHAKNQSPNRPNHRTAPAVAPISQAALKTQQKSRAERAQNRGKPVGRKNRKRLEITTTTSGRGKSIKVTTSIGGRNKQIRQKLSKTVIKKIKPAGLKVKTSFKKSKKTAVDPFSFPDSPPLSPHRHSGRKAKPSPKVLANSLTSKSVKSKNSAGLLRASLSANATPKRKMVSPMAPMSTPSSRLSKRVIIPSPKVRENADTTTELAGSNVRVVTGFNEKTQRASLDGSLPRGSLKSRLSETRRPLANKHNA
jgi:hypothetical protein